MTPELLLNLQALAVQYLKNTQGQYIDKIDAGGSAAVFKASRDGKIIALKVYDPRFFDDEVGPSERNRIDLQRQLIGNHCSSLVDTLKVVEELNTCFIEMEYISWPSLKKCLLLIPDIAIESLIAQLVNAVIFLEAAGLVHRDIKPENILINHDFTQLILIDLGIIRKTDAEEDNAGNTDQGLRRPFIATAQYSSPEYLFRLEAPSAESWRALTIYQVGAVLHDLIIKRPLFLDEVEKNNKFAVAFAVLRKPPDFSETPPNLIALASVAAKCLVKDPNLRLKLINWKLFINNEEDDEPTEKLRKLAETSRARKIAQNALELSTNTKKKQRNIALITIAQNIKKNILSSTDGTYKVVSYVQNDLCIPITITMPLMEVIHLKVVFNWGETDQSDISIVGLKAAVGIAPNQDAELLAIGEYSISDDSCIFDMQLLDGVANILSIASDMFNANKNAEMNDLVLVLKKK